MMAVDEFGIPKGEFTASCGCIFHGRSLLSYCDEHKKAFITKSLFGDYSFEAKPNISGLLKNFKVKPFYWEEYLNNLDIPSVQNLEEEFEQLRKEGPKWSSVQYHRVRHIEEHLDNGDVVCRCYEGGMRYETNDMG